jgi:hypothetical protein
MIILILSISSTSSPLRVPFNSDLNIIHWLTHCFWFSTPFTGVWLGVQSIGSGAAACRIVRPGRFGSSLFVSFRFYRKKFVDFFVILSFLAFFFSKFFCFQQPPISSLPLTKKHSLSPHERIWVQDMQFTRPGIRTAMLRTWWALSELAKRWVSRVSQLFHRKKDTGPQPDVRDAKLGITLKEKTEKLLKVDIELKSRQWGDVSKKKKKKIIFLFRLIIFMLECALIDSSIHSGVLQRCIKVNLERFHFRCKTFCSLLERAFRVSNK